MRKIIKKIPLLGLSLIMALSACGEPTATQKLIAEIKNSNIVIPNVDNPQGTISGMVLFKGLSLIPEETIIKVFDGEGKTLRTVKANEQGQFVISELPEGEMRVVVTNLQLSDEKEVEVLRGKVTNVGTFLFSETSKKATVSIAIQGKVVDNAGNPVENAKVTDFTGGFINNFTNTNAEGSFSLPVSTFTEPRSLEIQKDNLLTSISVKPDRTDNLIIPLIPNSRTLTGRVINSLIKNGVDNLTVSVDGGTSSAVTDKDGNFRLRGVPLNPVNLQIGEKDGYINRSFSVEQASDSTEKDLGEISVQPIGSIMVNLRPDASPFAGYILTEAQYNTLIASKPEYVFSYQQRNRAAGAGTCENFYVYDNSLLLYFTEVTGLINVEGTDIQQSYRYPATGKHIVEYTPCGEIDKTSERFDDINHPYSVIINNIAGGEYSISVTMPLHETQKGIRAVIPSNDTISTELIQLNRAKVVKSFGDIVGNILIKDREGNLVDFPTDKTLKVAAIVAEGDFDGTTLSSDVIVNQILAGECDSVSNFRDGTVDCSTDQNFHIRDVTTGSRVIVAGLFDSENSISQDYIPAEYVLVNVRSGVINKTTDIVFNQR